MRKFALLLILILAIFLPDWRKIGLTNLAQIQLGQAALGGESQNAAVQHGLMIAEGYLADLSDTYHNNSRYAIALGKVYFLRGEENLARNILTKEVDQQSFEDSVVLYKWLFRQQERAGYSYENVHEFAVSIGLDFPTSYVELGKRYLQHNDFQNAADNLNQAIYLSDKFGEYFIESKVEAIYWLGRMSYRRKNLDAAVSFFKDVVGLDPENKYLWFTHQSYLYLGDIFLEQNNCKLAAENYRKAYDTQTNSSQAARAKERCEALAVADRCNVSIPVSCEGLLK